MNAYYKALATVSLITMLATACKKSEVTIPKVNLPQENDYKIVIPPPLNLDGLDLTLASDTVALAESYLYSLRLLDATKAPLIHPIEAANIRVVEFKQRDEADETLVQLELLQTGGTQTAHFVGQLGEQMSIQTSANSTFQANLIIETACFGEDCKYIVFSIRDESHPDLESRDQAGREALIYSRETSHTSRFFWNPESNKTENSPLPSIDQAIAARTNTIPNERE